MVVRRPRCLGRLTTFLVGTLPPPERPVNDGNSDIAVPTDSLKLHALLVALFPPLFSASTSLDAGAGRADLDTGRGGSTATPHVLDEPTW